MEDTDLSTLPFNNLDHVTFVEVRAEIETFFHSINRPGCSKIVSDNILFVFPN